MSAWLSAALKEAFPFRDTPLERAPVHLYSTMKQTEANIAQKAANRSENEIEV